MSLFDCFLLCFSHFGNRSFQVSARCQPQPGMSSTSARYRIAFLDHDLMFVFFGLFDVVCLKTVTYSDDL